MDTLEDLKRKVKYATILGTLQSSLDNFRYLRKVWKDNQEEERLLGVSITGIMDHLVLSGKDCSSSGSSLFDFWTYEFNQLSLGEVLKELKQITKETNEEWAKLLGIAPSRQLTLIKPSGTVSQLCGTASGIHPRFSEFYLRRYTQDIKDPLTELMIDQGVPHVVKGERVIFTFPIKSPEASVTAREMGALQQLELWKIYREHWCDGNPSQTIYYTDKEFLDVQAWVYRNWDIIGGLSFFPLDDYVYDKETQPYLEITEEQYNKTLEEFPEEVDWSKLPLFEFEDTTQGETEWACSGGKCEL